MPDLSRLQIWAFVVIGGVVLALDMLIVILGDFQALDYLKLHWQSAYNFVVSPATHVVLLMVGIGMLGFAIWKLMQHPNSPDQRVESLRPIPLREPITQTQEMKNSGNASITQHFYGTPHQDPKPKPEPPKPPREPRFNFTYTGILPVLLLAEKKGYSVIDSPQYWRGFGTKQPALILEITNRPHKEFTPDYASGVIAEMIIDESTHVSPLLWLTNNRGEIDFSSAYPNVLLLAVADSEYSDHWVIPRYLPRVSEHGWKPVNTDFSIPVGVEPDVRIEISVGGRVVKEIPLSWTWPNQKLHVAVKQRV